MRLVRDQRGNEGKRRSVLPVVVLALAITAAVPAFAPGAVEPEETEVSKPLSFAVDSELRPHIDALPAQESGEPRPLAALADEFGNQGDFVANELIVATRDEIALQDLLKRWDGTLLSSFDPTEAGLDGFSPRHLVRIDPGLAHVDSLVEDVGRLDHDVRGAQRVSSEDGLRLLAAAARESVHGLEVDVNWVGHGQTIRQRTTNESPTVPPGVSPNPFTWAELCKAGQAGMTATTCRQNIGVGEAWTLLARRGLLPPARPVQLAIVDRGFTNGDPDWPAVTVQLTSGANPVPCVGGTPCSFHGNNVTAAAMGLVDNAFGAAGVAGPVARPIIVPGTSMFTTSRSLLIARLNGAEIANMSFQGEIPWSARSADHWSANQFDLLVSALRASGMLLFALAGNKGKDVDAQVCFNTMCSEAAYHWPCETPGVICVGGLAQNSTSVQSVGTNGGSNYGTGGFPAANSVDLWAPWFVTVGLDPSDAGFGTNPNQAKFFTGTSAASPFAAGVAALIWAANRNLSASQVESILFSTAQAASISAARSGPGGEVLPSADAAVVAALGGDAPPDIRITSPPNNSSHSRGYLSVSANATDDRGAPQVNWLVDGVRRRETGATINLSLFDVSFGQHTIRAEASDSAQQLVGDADGGITVTLTNDKPQVAIQKPTSGQTFYVYRLGSSSFGDTITLEGTSVDRNNNPPNLLDSQVSWTVGGSMCEQDKTEPCIPLSGHNGSLSALALGVGTHTVRFRGTDDDGLSDVVQLTIKVEESTPTPVEGSPPRMVGR